MMGDPSSVLMAAKLPGEAEHGRRLVGHVAPGGPQGHQAASPPPMAISGISGPSTAPKIKRGQRRQDHAGQLAGGRRRGAS